MSNKIKFKRDDKEQLDLGVKVMVSAYNSKCRYMTSAIAKALKKLDIRDAANLPRQDSLVDTFGKLRKAIKEQKRPEEATRGWQIVLQRAYDELTKKQVSMNDIKVEAPAEDVKVPDVDAQEDLMEQDAAQARAEEQIDELPFDELPIVPEDFDIWQSDAYSFLTAFCKYDPEGQGTVTMSLKSFEMLFRRNYDGRNIA